MVILNAKTSQNKNQISDYWSKYTNTPRSNFVLTLKSATLSVLFLHLLRFATLHYSYRLILSRTVAMEAIFPLRRSVANKY